MKVPAFLLERKPLIRLFFYLGLIGVALVIIRQFLPVDKAYLFLPWNLFLAMIPLGISSAMLYYDNLTSNAFLGICTGFVWLMFFPNAPYVITDYVHVLYGDRTYFVLDFLTWAYFACVAFLAGIISLQDMANVLKRNLHPALVIMIILIICVLSGFGIYLGRDLRFNSWDVLLKPDQLIYESINTLKNPEEGLFTLYSGALISVALFSTYILGNGIKAIVRVK